ncbi:uncharacterized protein LOC135336778 [Halichondria panicea]|uniref:uncharacterized protein LOC135336778 n=1 Tax=Halichondria panicea TaxID=6063 RepID=UPI00312B3FDF
MEYIHRGTFDLLLNTLVKPHEAKRCVRPVDTSFVKALAARFEEDPSSPGIPPIAALCVSVPSKEAFDTKRKDGYRYEVLGGQHSALARKENPENMALQRVLAEVYIGLTDDESLHLASRHNVNGHFVHKMTHRDYVEACRFKLFALAGTESSGETPETKSHTEWRDICKHCILPQDMGRCTMDNVFNQASFKSDVWKLHGVHYHGQV